MGILMESRGVLGVLRSPGWLESTYFVHSSKRETAICQFQLVSGIRALSMVTGDSGGKAESPPPTPKTLEHPLYIPPGPVPVRSFERSDVLESSR